MRSRVRYLLCCGMLLTSCGGSGSLTAVPGGGGSTPTPSPTSTPTPTPSPATTGEIKPTATTQSTASVQFLTVDAGGSTTSSRSVVAAGSVFSIAYDTPTHTYSLHNDQYTKTFGPGQFTQEASLPDYFPRVEYGSSTSSDQDFLIIFKAPNASPALPLSYAAYGAWQHNIAQASSTTRVRLDYFTYGTPTPAASVPQVGTTVYRWAGTGNYADNSRLFFAQSSGTMTVDWAAHTVTLSILLSGSDFFGGNSGGLIGTTATGTIAGNGMSGPLSFSIATYNGTFKGQFFGPNAEEFGLVFAAAGDPATFNGAIVGTRL